MSHSSGLTPTDTLVRDAARDNLRRSVEFRAEPSADGLTLDGYAAVFNEWTEIHDRSGSFMEQIAPGAFKRSIGDKTPVLQFDHGAHPLIGSIPLGRITHIVEDEHGLRVKAKLSDNWLVEPVRDAIRDGGITGMSFRFSIPDGGDRWERRDGVDYRTINAVNLMEAGPVTWPAYTATSVSVRGRQAVAALADPEVRREVAALLTLGADDIRAIADESLTHAPDLPAEGARDAVEALPDGALKTRTKNQRRAIVAGLYAQGGSK